MVTALLHISVCASNAARSAPSLPFFYVSVWHHCSRCHCLLQLAVLWKELQLTLLRAAAALNFLFFLSYGVDFVARNAYLCKDWFPYHLTVLGLQTAPACAADSRCVSFF